MGFQKRNKFSKQFCEIIVGDCRNFSSYGSCSCNKLFRLFKTNKNRPFLLSFLTTKSCQKWISVIHLWMWIKLLPWRSVGIDLILILFIRVVYIHGYIKILVTQTTLRGLFLKFPLNFVWDIRSRYARQPLASCQRRCRAARFSATLMADPSSLSLYFLK